MLCGVALLLISQAAPEISLWPSTGPILTSVRIKPGTYVLPDTGGAGALQIGADGVTIDFQGATLESPEAKSGRLETFNGIGLAIQDHKNITVRNAHIHGFQYNVKVLRSSGVTLENCELGQSRSQKILDGDSPNQIWLDVRGLDSWRGYGAGAWIEKSSGCMVRGVQANQCQNGLILVNADNNKVVGCDFSYNSGWGIALCGASRNVICWNHADFVNRPWGSGWGGDSSGVVLTTGSNQNTWAYNSFTHGGDGFFLATQNGGFDDQGKLHADGTCDRNIVMFNDGSWAQANAFESTFSTKNAFYHNWCNDCNYGFWLGYSNRNLIQGNIIKRSQIDGIAHEQGAQNLYLNNDIEATRDVSIHLWGGTDPRFVQSPSTLNAIIGNKIFKARASIEQTNSTNNFLTGNVIRDAPPVTQSAPPGPAVDALAPLRATAEIRALRPPGFRMYRDTDLPKGWQWFAASEYGMRDYRQMTVPWMMKDARTLRLYTPKPGVPWTMGLPDWMVETRGDAPRELYVTAKPSAEPVGGYRSFRIQVTRANGLSEWIVGRLLDLKWHVRWFRWFRNDHSAYTDSAAWAALFAGPAVREDDLPDLPKIRGYVSPIPELPADHFALVGSTKVRLDGGRYRFDTISDDGIEVLVDGRVVVDNWTHHGATADSGQVDLVPGTHSIEVHYCQEDGDAALSVHWTKI